MTNTFKEAFYFFRKNFLELLVYTFATGLIFILLAHQLISFFSDGMTSEELNPDTIFSLTQLMNLIFRPIYLGGMIICIFGLAVGQAKGVYHSLLSGIKHWPYMFIANILTSLLISVGLLALLIPGIWIFSRLFLVPYLIMLKNQTPLEAIVNSFHYTKGYSFKILIDIALLIIVFISAIIILSLFQILHPLVLLITLLLFHTMAYVIYYRHYEILINANNQYVKSQI